MLTTTRKALGVGLAAGLGLLSATLPAHAEPESVHESNYARAGIAHANPAQSDLTNHVNPFIGTDDSNSPNPVPGGAGGSTYPGAVVPFGGVQFSPDTPTASPSGYRYDDDSVESFSLTHFDGAGCANNEDLPLLPITGELGASPGTNWTDYASTHDKAVETAAPGYYKTRLLDYSTDVELTSTTRTGMARLTFPADTTSKLLINTSRSATGDRDGQIDIDGRNVTGTVTAGGFCGSDKTYQIHFAMEFDRDPTGHGTWLGSTVSDGSSSTSGTGSGGYLTFDTTSDPVVQAKVGISYVSVENARENLTTENPNWNFDGVRSAADRSWNDILQRVQVNGGTDANLEKFYTALYHVLQSPNISSDVNGEYMGFDYQVHTADHPVYQNYSGWDIYRSWAALVALVAPDEMTDIVKSMVLDGQQGGLLPKWSQQNQEDFVMTGDPGPIIVASAHAFGVREFDRQAALDLMKKASEGGTMQGDPIRGLQSGYEERHYIHENPSDSMEYSASDFAVAQFAKALGDTATHDLHMERAQWWINVFNTESGYIHKREPDGSWPWPLDPADPDGYTEGNASQYTWMVPYNFDAVIDLMGGPSTAAQRLDQHFTELNGGLERPYFYIGNEPEHNVPWAYTYARQPWGTQSAVRRVMSESFTTGPGGLPGNDDLGATSAWYVWSALGMFPVTPGADVLVMHGPLFESASVQLAGGNELRVNGTGVGDESPYVQELSVDGTATTKTWLRYDDIAGGATLDFGMGPDPDQKWGSDPADVPPSYSAGFDPPPDAPELGPNLAADQPATGSAPCNDGEGAANAFDGSLSRNSKWCSTETGTRTLQVDLGSAQDVGAVVLKHAGLGAETTGWNTADFTIQTSTDGSTWTEAATVTGNRSSRTLHEFDTRQARYVKLDITTPTNNGNGAARIYELEVYGGTS